MLSALSRYVIRKYFQFSKVIFCSYHKALQGCKQSETSTMHLTTIHINILALSSVHYIPAKALDHQRKSLLDCEVKAYDSNIMGVNIDEMLLLA